MRILLSLPPLKLLCFIVLFLMLVSTINHILWGVPGHFQVDLRNRIIGSRAIEEGYSPYHYQWKNGHDERLLDPRVFTTDFLVNYVTVPPSTLLLQKPLSKLPYPLIKDIWFFFQLLTLFFIIGWFTFSRFPLEHHRLWVIIAGGTMAISMGWYFHLLVGQLYIVYPLVLTLAFACSHAKNKYLLFTGGSVLGMAIVFRPSFAILLLPFCLSGHSRMCYGMITGTLSGVVIFILPYLDLWKYYADAMSFWSSYNFQIDTIEYLDIPAWVPQTIEGFKETGVHRCLDPCNASIQYQLFTLMDIKINTISLAGLYLLSTGIILFALRKKLPKMALTHSFLLGASLIILSDYFLPAPRHAYNNIQWIFPVLLYIRCSKMKFLPGNYLIFSGLLLNLYPLYWINLNMWMGELLILSGIILYIKYNHHYPVKANIPC